MMASGSNSPDIFFVPADLDGDGVVQKQQQHPTASVPVLHRITPRLLLHLLACLQTEFVYASFFTGAGLGLAWSDGAPGTPFGLGTIQTLSIDASIAPAFSASVTDLNNDGKPDVLVTNHVDDAPKSGVWAYEPPRPPAALNDTSAWVKHTLATGFKVTEPGFHQAAPGAAFAVYPRMHDTAGKPYVVCVCAWRCWCGNATNNNSHITMGTTYRADTLSWLAMAARARTSCHLTRSSRMTGLTRCRR